MAIPSVNLNVDPQGYAGSLLRPFQQVQQSRALRMPNFGSSRSGLGRYLKKQARNRDAIAKAQLKLLQQSLLERKRGTRDEVSTGAGGNVSRGYRQESTRPIFGNATRGERQVNERGRAGMMAQSLLSSPGAYRGDPFGAQNIQNMISSIGIPEAQRGLMQTGRLLASQGSGGVVTGPPQAPPRNPYQFYSPPPRFKKGTLPGRGENTRNHPFFMNAPANFKDGSLPGTLPTDQKAKLHKGEVVLSADQVDEPLMRYLMGDKLSKLGSGQMDGKGTGPGKMPSYQAGSDRSMFFGRADPNEFFADPRGNVQPPQNPWTRPVAPGSELIPVGDTRGVRVGSGPGAQAFELGAPGSTTALAPRGSSALAPRAEAELVKMSEADLVRLAKARNITPKQARSALKMGGKAGLVALIGLGLWGALSGGEAESGGDIIGTPPTAPSEDIPGAPDDDSFEAKVARGEIISSPWSSGRFPPEGGVAPSPGLSEPEVAAEFDFAGPPGPDPSEDIQGWLAQFGPGPLSSPESGTEGQLRESAPEYSFETLGITPESVGAVPRPAEIPQTTDPATAPGLPEPEPAGPSLSEQMLAAAEESAQPAQQKFDINSKEYHDAENAARDARNLRYRSEQMQGWLMKNALGGGLSPEMYKTMSDQIKQFDSLADAADKRREKASTVAKAEKQLGDDRVQDAYATGIQAEIGNEEAIQTRLRDMARIDAKFNVLEAQWDEADDEKREELIAKMAIEYRQKAGLAQRQISQEDAELWVMQQMAQRG